MRGHSDGHTGRRREQPDDEDHQTRVLTRDARLKREHDGAVAVQADGDQAEGGDEDGDCLGEGNEATNRLTKRPVAEENYGWECKRNTQDSHQQISCRHVG